jgi:hypothetical protein
VWDKKSIVLKKGRSLEILKEFSLKPGSTLGTFCAAFIGIWVWANALPKQYLI